MKTLILYAILSALFIFFNSCNLDLEGYVEDNQKFAYLDKSSGSPGSIISIETDIIITSSNYTGNIQGTPVEMNNAGNSLSFMVPEMSTGNYILDLKLDKTNYSLELEILRAEYIADPEKYLTDLVNELSIEVQKNNTYKDSLIANGNLDPVVAKKDLSVWEGIQQQADLEFAAMTPEQKQKLANFIEANRDWIDNITSIGNGEFGLLKSTSDCESLRKEGLQAIANKETFKAIGIAVDYKWCQAKQFVNAKTDNVLSKAILIWENTTHPWATVTLMNLIGRKIDALGDEIANIGNSEFVGDDIDNWDEYKSNKTLTWYNGERKKILTKIIFRAPLKSDMSTSGTLGDFASEFDNFINAYSEYVYLVSPELIWRPEFRTKTKTLDFNRHLSVPKASISNSNVVLVNTQLMDDHWEIIFATDDNNDQEFSFDIVYNDGVVSISETFNAIVGAEKYSPPTANLEVSSETGNTTTNFSFDGSGSFDMETSKNDLRIRWDWNNDGNWDTSYSTEKIRSHQYSISGTYLVMMEVIDGSNLTSTDSVLINVYDTFTDPRDGNSYNIITIDTQTWMVENLAYLPSVSGPDKDSSDDPYYYVYDYEGTSVPFAKATDNYITYGVLYNWEAAKTACPAGWHLPTDIEWTVLTNYLTDKEFGYSGSDIGKTMASSSGWHLDDDSGNVGNDQFGNNRSGFNALPGGYSKSQFDIFIGLGLTASFWSFTEHRSSNAWCRRLEYDYDGITKLSTSCSNGYSVRCLKN